MPFFRSVLITLFLLTLALSACRAPTATITPFQPTALILPTHTPIVLPTLLPTLTPRPTFTPTATSTLLPTFTDTATRRPATATPTADANATPTLTPTLDPITLYEQAVPLCENAFVPTQTLTTTLAGAHLPTFILINRADETTLWEPRQGLEWIEAETSGDVHTITCIRQTQRLDATYSDQALGYTLRWDLRLITWPQGWLLGSETFWGEGPPLQNLTGSIIYGKPPTARVLRWIACDLHPNPFTTLCGSGGPLAFSSDSLMLVAGQEAWNIADGQPYAAYRQVASPSVLALSPDGNLVASADTGERDIHLWQARSGEAVRILSGHTSAITGLAFSPDGAWLLSASQEGNLIIWNAQTGENKQHLADNLGWLHAPIISPDGKLAAVATWGQPGLIYIWDWQAALQANGPLNPLHTIEASEIYINALAFSPDNLLLASAGLDGIVKLWDMATALEEGAGVRLVGLLQGHTDSVTSLAFSPDGQSLASGSNDASVIVWDVTKGTSRRILPGAPGTVTSVAYSPDGTWLAASSEGLTRLWPSP